jgi:hypothetical protein
MDLAQDEIYLTVSRRAARLAIERVLALDLRSPLPSSDARGGVGEQILGVEKFGRHPAVVSLGDIGCGLEVPNDDRT